MIKPIDTISGRKINFVEFNAKVNTLATSSVFPKYGTVLLATILREKGYDVKVYLEGVSDMSFERISDCDIVCLPVFSPAYNKVREFCLSLRKERPSVPIIIGGPFVILYGGEPMLSFSDYMVMCEGDEALPELLGTIFNGGDPALVNGIMFMKAGKAERTPDRRPPAIPETVSDLTLIDGFSAASAGIGRFTNVVNTLQTSRGCNFRCKFCPTSRLFAESYRSRDPASVISEIREKQKYNDMFFVVDNSFFGDKERAKELLQRIAKERLGAEFIVFERHEIADDDEMLSLMREAGIRCMIVGVESLVDETLAAFDKRQKAEKVVAAIRKIKSNGIHVIATFAIGFDGDTPSRIMKIPEFIHSNRLSLNAFILHDVNNKSETGLMIPMQRRFRHHYGISAPGDTAGLDYATGSFVTYFPKNMKPSTLQKCLIDLYRVTYTNGYIFSGVFSKSPFESMFKAAHGFAVRRLNECIANVCEKSYFDYLRKIEEGLYDRNENLIEDRLEKVNGLPLPPPLEDQVNLRSYRFLAFASMLPGAIRGALERNRRRK